MIQIKSLQKSYSGNVVLNIPELTIEKGEIFGLVGNNGAGKTTLFSLILDLIKASKGEAIINNIEVSKSEEWKGFTSAYLDESFTIGYLKPEEYFNLIGDLHNMTKQDISLFLDRFKELFNNQVLNSQKLIRDLSKGNQKKTGVAGAFMGSPEVIILDEPFANLDPSSQFILRKIIKSFASEYGTTFLISSHNLDNITDVCSRIVILEEGIIVKDVEKSENTLAELENFFTGAIKNVDV